METAELDTALEELEVRLERLRGLYEQYFLGLEKIEPQVARKDVDRRIYVLRREKIRNTAKRFKLQTIIQRYNTFQQYWQRICREIENGTYKRHLLRAQKQSGQLLTIAARKRLGRAGRISEPAEPPTENASPIAPAHASSEPSATPATAPARAPAPSALAPAPAPASASAPTADAAPKPAPPKRPAQKFESLDLDMDFMGDWDPGASRAAAAPKPAAPALKPTFTAPAAAPKPAPPAPALPATPAAAPKPTSPARPASIPPAPVLTPPRPASSRPPQAPARPLPPRIPMSPRIPPAASPKPASALPRPATALPKPAAAPPAKIAPTPPLPPKPAPPAPMPPNAVVAPPPAAAPPPRAAAAPSPRAAAAPPSPAAAPPKVAASAPTGLDDGRLRDLHSRLQQAKQQTKEGNVSFEGLAKSIRAAEAKLREQHKNRKIDFDVVIKDGKAVVKPIVK